MDSFIVFFQTIAEFENKNIQNVTLCTKQKP